MLLTDQVQAHYAVVYGRIDKAPIEAAHFRLPDGYFVVAYVGGVPAAMGGWRRHDAAEAEAEVKRMFVRDEFRRLGLARSVLDHLEESAGANDFRHLVLETNLRQPEAVALYRSSGFTDVPAFGYYSDSVHLGKRL